MSGHSITVEAIFENGILRPTQPLALSSSQRVTLIIQIHGQSKTWPENAAAIYQEIEAADRNLAEKMLETIAETWPQHQE